MNMEIPKEQFLLIECMKEECAKPIEDQSTFYNSVWFYPPKGMFLFGDKYLSSDIVAPLIDEGKLKYAGQMKHQGEKMLRYVLA